MPLIYTFNLAGYRPSALPAGERGRYTLGGFTDATFTAMKVLEDGPQRNVAVRGLSAIVAAPPQGRPWSFHGTRPVLGADATTLVDVSRPVAQPLTAGGYVSPLGPGGRPFARWRPAAALLSLGALLISAVLLMSDRAPGLLSRVSARIDAGSSRAARLAAGTRPQSDFEIHIIVWAVIALLVGLTMWSNRSLVASAIVVLLASVIAERAQAALTTTRELQLSDLVGNTLGVLAGVGLVTCLAALMDWKDP